MSDPATLTPIDEGAGLWGIERWNQARWHFRSTVVRGPDGLVVVTPTRGTTADVGDALDQLGPVRVLLAPNSFHHLGLPEYRERFPEAALVASADAAARVSKKTGLEFQPLEAAATALPEGVTVLEPPGLKTGEVWLRAETSRGVAWVITDAFFNLERNPTGGMGLACRLLAVTPGLRVSRTYTMLAVADKAAHRAWVYEQLEHDRPRLLIPAHGRVLEADDLTDRLRAACEQRMGR
jgi:hypothetical protein